MSQIPTLFPITIMTNVKNNFIMNLVFRRSTRDVNIILDRYPLYRWDDIYLHLREIQFHNKTAEMTIFENAYEEYIMYLN